MARPARGDRELLHPAPLLLTSSIASLRRSNSNASLDTACEQQGRSGAHRRVSQARVVAAQGASDRSTEQHTSQHQSFQATQQRSGSTHIHLGRGLARRGVEVVEVGVCQRLLSRRPVRRVKRQQPPQQRERTSVCVAGGRGVRAWVERSTQTPPPGAAQCSAGDAAHSVQATHKQCTGNPTQCAAFTNLRVGSRLAGRLPASCACWPGSGEPSRCAPVIVVVIVGGSKKKLE